MWMMLSGVYENFDEYNRLEIGIVMPFMSRGSLMGICYNNKLLPYEMKVKFAYEAALGTPFLFLMTYYSLSHSFISYSYCCRSEISSREKYYTP